MRYAYSIGDCPDFEGSYETVDAALKAAEKCIAWDIKKGFDPFSVGLARYWLVITLQSIRVWTSMMLSRQCRILQMTIAMALLANAIFWMI